MAFEFDEFVLAAKGLEKTIENIEQIHMKVAKRIALLAIRKVKQKTPVDTGELRRRWKYEILKNGDIYAIIISNPVEYASFVEKGHRLVMRVKDGDGYAKKTIGWIEGKFMLELTMSEMDQLSAHIWKVEVEKELRKAFE